MSRSRTYQLFGLLALVLGGLGYGYHQLVESPRVRATHVVSLYPVDDMRLLSATGYAVPFRKASLSSKITGRLVWLGVREGSRVHAGEVVARLDGDEYRATVEQAVAHLDLLQSHLSEARATLVETDLASRRVMELHQNGFMSTGALDVARARKSIAEAAVAAARAEIRVGEAALRNARVTLDQTRIVAPFEGVIVGLNANVGDIVTPFSASLEAKGAVLTIADMSSLEIRMDIPESQIQQVAPGQSCLVRLDAFPNTRLPCSVSSIVPLVDRAKGTVELRARFEGAISPNILPDMSAHVDIIERKPSAADLLPVTVVDQDALLRDTAKPSVYRIVKGQVHLARVRTGRRFGHLVEIVEGLSPGDSVVLLPLPGLKDKAFVRSEP